MKSNRVGKSWLAVLCSIVLVGGAASLLSSPTANASAGINWGHIWKTQIMPRADKRYYTKKKARAKFAAKSSLAGYTPSGTAYTKAESDAKYALNSPLANYYTKAQSDANYYSKAQSDAKYAPFPSQITGTYIASGMGNTVEIDDSVSWGVTLNAAPTVHYIKVGDPVPAGCSGTSTAPVAAPGNLCVFETGFGNVGTRSVSSSFGNFGAGSVNGVYVAATPSSSSFAYVRGVWAVRAAGIVTSRTGVSGAVNRGRGAGGPGSSR